MPRDSNGNYTLPAAYNPVVSGTVILAQWANTTMPDVGTEVTNSLDRSGRGPMLAQLKLIDGTAVAPGVAFASELNSGLYRSSAGELSFSLLAVQQAKLSATGFTFIAPPTYAADPVSANQLVRQSYATNAANITSGTLPDSVHSANVALLNNVQSFTGAKTFTANVNPSVTGFSPIAGGWSAYDATRTVDNHLVKVLWAAGVYQHRFINDADSLSTNLWQVNGGYAGGVTGQSWNTGSGGYTFNMNGNVASTLGVANSGTGASAASKFTLSTGTANSTLAFSLYDNTGAPYGQVDQGSGLSQMIFPGKTTFQPSLAAGDGLNIGVGASTVGAVARWTGQGGVTPSKYLRVNNGVMEWVNNANNAVIMSLTDAGVLNVLSNITINGAALPVSALVLLAVQTANNSASLDFTSAIDGTYEEYQFHITGLIPGTVSAALMIRTSSNAGVSFDAGASDYISTYGMFTGSGAGGWSGSGSTATSGPLLNGGSNNGTVTGGMQGILVLHTPANTGSYKQMWWDGVNCNSAGDISRYLGSATRQSTSAVNGVRFVPSSGNIAQGVIRMYGVKKS